MKRLAVTCLTLCFAATAIAELPQLDQLLKSTGQLKAPAAATPDEQTRAAGIREALAVGTRNAVQSLGRKDGYFANEAVRILMPKKLRKVADIAGMAGYQKQVDEFVLSMNRAAEAAAPLAADYFGDAIRDMTLDDVRSILTGGDTAATQYFSSKTRDKLYATFRPVVAGKIREVGATRAYQDMMQRFEDVPMVGKQPSLDLEDYVTNQSLDGLFRMVGEEERKIRTNPAARTTDLLRTVFGR